MPYVTIHGTGLPLRLHRNPQYAHASNNVLAVTVSGLSPTAPPFSSRFCSRGFIRQSLSSSSGQTLEKRVPKSTATTHGRLLCTQFNSRITGSFLRGNTTTVGHPFRSPRRMGQRPHAIAARPAFLTPSIHPRLGVGSKHQELHRCALNGFLGPFSKTVLPTRILHHLK